MASAGATHQGASLIDRHPGLTPPVQSGQRRRTTDPCPRLQGIETTDPDAEQPPVNPDGSKTEWCGQACLAFGLVCKAYGYNIARAV